MRIFDRLGKWWDNLHRKSARRSDERLTAGPALPSDGEVVGQIKECPAHYGPAFTEQITQRQAIAVAVPNTINSGGTASLTTQWMDARNLRRFRALLNLGAVAGGGAVTFKLQAAVDNAGTSSADIGGNATITGITTANQPNSLEIRADQLPAGKNWVRAVATETGGQNVVADLILIGDDAGYKPGNQSDRVTWTNNVVF